MFPFKQKQINLCTQVWPARVRYQNVIQRQGPSLPDPKENSPVFPSSLALYPADGVSHSWSPAPLLNFPAPVPDTWSAGFSERFPQTLLSTLNFSNNTSVSLLFRNSKKINMVTTVSCSKWNQVKSFRMKRICYQSAAQSSPILFVFRYRRTVEVFLRSCSLLMKLVTRSHVSHRH